MNTLKDSFKRYLLIKYTQSKLIKCKKELSKNLPWIQGKSLFNTINTHMYVLLDTLFNNPNKQCLRQNKFIVDSIFKYTLERSENLLKSNKKTKDINEIKKGIEEHKNQKTIKFNIEKQLSEIQERMDSKENTTDEILQSVISR